MSRPRSTNTLVVLVCQCFFLTNVSFAHPASGIVVDAQVHVYFIYSGHGVMRLDPSGKLTTIHEDKGGHWLALDAGGAFSQVRPKEFERITPDGTIPSLILASGGAPLVVGPDGNLYYGSDGSQQESFPPGAMTVGRFSASGRQELFAPLLKEKLTELNDGITGLASGPDGSIYVATWNGIMVLNANGSVAKIVYPVVVNDCDSDPADHNPGQCFVPLSARSRHRFPWQRIRCGQKLPSGCEDRSRWSDYSILKSERPWSPTGVAVGGEDIYVLEYTNANGPKTEGWYPRVRQRATDGRWITLVTVSPETPPHL